MRKLLTNLAVFLIFFGCGFKPIYKMTSDDASIDGYSVEVTNQVAREIIEEVNSTIVQSEDQAAYMAIPSIDDYENRVIIYPDRSPGEYCFRSGDKIYQDLLSFRKLGKGSF